MSRPSVDLTGRGSSLAFELEPAQAHAERHFGAGAPPAWPPAPPRGAASARPHAARRIAAVLALATLALAYAWTLRPARTADPAAAALPMDEFTAPQVDDDEEHNAGGAPPPVQRPTTGVLTLSREGATWHLAASGASRLAAAQRLAQLGAGTLHGDPGLLAGSRPLDLRWHGRRLADAWPAVLGADASYAMQCGRGRCEVWLIAAAVPGVATARPLRAPVLPEAAPMPDLPPAIPASPSDSTDPRVAAHHD